MPSANQKDISGLILRDDTDRETTRRKTAVPVMFPYLNLNNFVFHYVYFFLLIFFTFGGLTLALLLYLRKARMILGDEKK